MNTKLLTLKAFSVLIIFLIPYIISKFYGIENYGEYAIIVAYVSFLSIFLLTGLEKYVLKEFSTDLKEGNVLVPSLFTNFGKITIIFLFVIVINKFFEFENLYIVILLVLIQSSIFICSAALKSAGKIFENELVFNLLRPSLLLVLLYGAYLIFDAKNINMFISLAVSLLLVFLIQLFILSRLTQRSFNPRYIEIKNYYQFWFIGFGTAVINHIDIIIGSIYLTELQIAQYSIAAKFSLIPTLISATLYPLLIVDIKKWISGQQVNLERKIKQKIKIVFILSTLVFIFLMALSNYIFPLFNLEPKDMRVLCSIIYSANLLGILAGPCFIVSNLVGNEKQASIISLVGVLLFVILAIVLLEWLGAVGLAISYLITIIFMNYSLVYVNFKKTKLVYFFRASI